MPKKIGVGMGGIHISLAKPRHKTTNKGNIKQGEVIRAKKVPQGGASRQCNKATQQGEHSKEQCNKTRWSSKLQLQGDVIRFNNKA